MIYTRQQKFAGSGRIFAVMNSDTEPDTFPKTTDEVEDIKDGFKFATGSAILIVSTSEVYRYNADGEKWVLAKSSGGGGGGGDIDPDMIATDEELEKYLDDLDIWGD